MRLYVGDASGTVGAHTVMVFENDNLIGPLRHHRKHSPDGFSWGYGGSGPAELARCLLIDVLGDRAWCRGCDGTGKGKVDGQMCLDCWGEKTSFKPGVYQEFKFAVIAPLNTEHFELTDVDIRAWLETSGNAPLG